MIPGLVSAVSEVNTGSAVEIVSVTDATVLILPSAIGGVNAGSMVEHFASADALILALVSVVGEVNTGSGFGAIKAFGEIRGISISS